MKLKLIDIKTDTHEVQFGTCELCFGYGTVDAPTFTFQKDSGEQIEIDGYYWSWGDYDEIYVDNAILFAEFLSSKAFPEDTVLDYNWLNFLVDEYYESQEEPVKESTVPPYSEADYARAVGMGLDLSDWSDYEEYYELQEESADE